MCAAFAFAEKPVLSLLVLSSPGRCFDPDILQPEDPAGRSSRIEKERGTPSGPHHRLSGLSRSGRWSVVRDQQVRVFFGRGVSIFHAGLTTVEREERGSRHDKENGIP